MWSVFNHAKEEFEAFDHGLLLLQMAMLDLHIHIQEVILSSPNGQRAIVGYTRIVLEHDFEIVGAEAFVQIAICNEKEVVRIDAFPYVDCLSILLVLSASRIT